MKVRTEHFKAIRGAYKSDPSNNELSDLYEEMALSVRPKITEAMLKPTQLIIDGNTVDEASEAIGISKVAVSQSVVKGLNRLARFYETLGGELPDDLKGDFNLPKAKNHLSFFSGAMICFKSPKQSIVWEQ